MRYKNKKQNLLPGVLVISTIKDKAKLRIYDNSYPKSTGRCYINPGEIGMYIKTVKFDDDPDYDDNIYLFGETVIAINTTWTEGRIVPYEIQI